MKRAVIGLYAILVGCLIGTAAGCIIAALIWAVTR